jgi:hypothetical protein
MEKTIEEEIYENIKALEDIDKIQSKVRNDIVSKLATVVLTMDIDPAKEKPSSILAKTALIDSYIKTSESLHIPKENIIKLKQKSKAVEDKKDAEAMIAKTIVDFLSKVPTELERSPNNGKLVTSVDDTIEKIIKDDNIEVNEGELTIDKPTVNLDT